MSPLDAGQEVIIATGAAGNFGGIVARALMRKHRVVAVDRRPMRAMPDSVIPVVTDVRRRAIEDVFRTYRVKAIVHQGLEHNPRGEPDRYRFNVVGTERLLDLAAKYKVARFVMLSSATIYGPDPDNSYFLDEHTPLLGAEHHPEIRDLVAADRIVQSFFYRQPEVQTTILRPVHIIGPRVRNAASNYLRLPRPWMLTGFDPMVQFIHEEDAVTALLLALESDNKGVFNIVGPGEAPLSRLLKVLGKSPRWVPWFVGRSLLRGTWRFHVAGFRPSELRHVQYNCIVDGQRARSELGFSPGYSLFETIRSVHGGGAFPSEQKSGKDGNLSPDGKAASLGS